jgi:hypothetical protein
MTDIHGVYWMWLDDSGDPIEKQVRRAVEYYEKKHARTAKKVLLNSSLEGKSSVLDKIEGIEVGFADNVLTYHIWVGEGDPPFSKDKGAGI